MTSLTLESSVSTETTTFSKKPRAKKNASASSSELKKAAAIESTAAVEPDEVKKRGRKPRGAKIIVNTVEVKPEPVTLPNIILHLRCTTKELNEYNLSLNKIVTDPLQYNPNIPLNISTYNDGALNQTYFSFEQGENYSLENTTPINNGFAYDYTTNIAGTGPLYYCSKCAESSTLSVGTVVGSGVSTLGDVGASAIAANNAENENANMREINTKLKHLKVQLYKNCLPTDKTSACFWCTCEYDNTPCYIPKNTTDSSIYGYGSFCRPECAVAYLMKENIDDSTKFERYHLLNQVYGKEYGYKKNIKPAPNPYYLLDKYYGNLTIQQYRKLLKSEHLLSVVDKPITRILPELHEDNDDTIMNIYGIDKATDKPAASSAISTSGYKVKRQSERPQGPSKSSIILQKFGLSAGNE